MRYTVVLCQYCWTIQKVWPGTPFVPCIRCRRVNPVPIPPTILVPSPTRNLVWPPHSPKRAVIVGISYNFPNFQCKLEGSKRDASLMHYHLTHRFGFPASSIWMLTEEETNPYNIPTKQNIMRALGWLVHGCQQGDSLVFHFSGHGANQEDKNGDEFDGFDETILPLDFMTQGAIVDDDINATIIRPLPYGVKLHAIIDACCSGTVLDLPFLCKMNNVWERCGPSKGNFGGEAISFSACNDKQASADSKAFTGVVRTGALTYSFIEATYNWQGITYGNIMNYLKARVNNTIPGWRQDPQLTSNVTFDIYSKPFSL